MNEAFYKGAQGNLSLHVVTITLAALAGAASSVLSSRLPIGTEIVGVRYNSANLGAGTGIKIDVVDQAGASTSVLAATTTTAVVSGIKPLKPIYISDNGPSDLVLTNSGASAATGEVTIGIEYRFKGY